MAVPAQDMTVLPTPQTSAHFSISLMIQYNEGRKKGPDLTQISVNHPSPHPAKFSFSVLGLLAYQKSA
jgi:hypothetical protein